MPKLFNMKLKVPKKGFTIIELLVVLGMIGIVCAVAVPAFAMIQKNISLKNYTKEIVSNLRRAQSMAVASQDGLDHGIFFSGNEYGICEQNCTVRTTTYSLDNGISIVAGAGTSVVFNRLTGNATPQTIEVGFAGGKHNTIQINETGLITATY